MATEETNVNGPADSRTETDFDYVMNAVYMAWIASNALKGRDPSWIKLQKWANDGGESPFAGKRFDETLLRELLIESENSGQFGDFENVLRMAAKRRPDEINGAWNPCSHGKRLLTILSVL